MFGKLAFCQSNFSPYREDIMENCKIAIDSKGIMTITVDTKAKGTTSATGKSQVIASTKGNQSVTPDGLKVGLNVYRAV